MVLTTNPADGSVSLNDLLVNFRQKTQNRHLSKKIKNRRSFGGFFAFSDIIKRSYHTNKAVDRKDNVGYL